MIPETPYLECAIYEAYHSMEATKKFESQIHVFDLITFTVIRNLSTWYDPQIEVQDANIWLKLS